MLEFMGLGNHRKSIRSEIAHATNRVREVQLGALDSYWREHGVATLPSGNVVPDDGATPR